MLLKATLNEMITATFLWSSIYLLRLRLCFGGDVVPCPGDGTLCIDVFLYVPFICIYLPWLDRNDYPHLLNISDRGDYKCNHDATHRVCAKLVDNEGGKCKNLKWGSKNFWELTDQVQFEWSNLICSDKDRDGMSKPPGEHWCICMWATERMINNVPNPYCTHKEIILLFGSVKLFNLRSLLLLLLGKM